jgi:hypothetical protein
MMKLTGHEDVLGKLEIHKNLVVDFYGNCQVGLDSTGSGQGPVAGCCGCGDEPSGSCVTELVSY